MKKLRSHIFFKSIALLFFTTYLFYALTNIFTSTGNLNRLPDSANYAGMSHRRNTFDIYTPVMRFTRLADKCFLDENQFNSIKFTGFLLITIFTFLLVENTQRVWWPLTRLFCNKQYAYLALRTLRI
jgi:hypothetical protein